MDAELQDQLYQRYPAVFAERKLPETETSMCWGITTGNGWYQLIDGLCAQLQRETDENGAPQVVATQVKEKIGTLRFYTRDLSDRQSAMIALAVELSGRICDICGAPGAPVNIQRMRATRCTVHNLRNLRNVQQVPDAPIPGN